MKIEKLIEVYEKLVPIYESKGSFKHYICVLARRYAHKNLRDLFSPRGYYRNYIKVVFSFGLKSFVLDVPSPFTKEGAKARLKFMENEIVELKNLLSEGYTDV